MPLELPEVLNPDIARAGWRELEPLARMIEALSPMSCIAGPVADRLRISSLEMTQYMRNQLLRDADWAGMAHSVEIRVPLMDYTLLRALAPLRASQNAPGKIDMASAPDRVLPTKILNRPKTGFGVPVREWLLGNSGNTPESAERGLRGWAQHVLKAFSRQ